MAEVQAGVELGEVVECTVEQIMPYGAFVRISKTGRKGMIHISELSYSFVKSVSDVLKLQDNIQAKVIRIDDKGRIDLSLKQTQEPPERPQKQAARQDSGGRQHREFTREFKGTRDFHEMQTSYRAANPDDSDTFEKKMASFLKTSEAKITDLNTRNSARAGRPSKRRNNNREH